MCVSLRVCVRLCAMCCPTNPSAGNPWRRMCPETTKPLAWQSPPLPKSTQAFLLRLTVQGIQAQSHQNHVTHTGQFLKKSAANHWMFSGCFQLSTAALREAMLSHLLDVFSANFQPHFNLFKVKLVQLSSQIWLKQTVGRLLYTIYVLLYN